MNEVFARLRMKASQRLVVINAPESYRKTLDELPEEVVLAESLADKPDFIHYFAKEQADLEHAGPQLKAAMTPQTTLWVSYPKGMTVPTDLKRDVVREVLGRIGLQTVSQVAIDEVWSALRLKLA